MENSEREDDVNFRVPEQLGESAEGASRGPGGKRRGAGRKRLHEAGYESVRDLFWKTMSIRTAVFDEWKMERERHRFKNNTEFARFLLENSKTLPTGNTRENTLGLNQTQGYVC